MMSMLSPDDLPITGTLLNNPRSRRARRPTLRPARLALGFGPLAARQDASRPAVQDAKPAPAPAAEGAPGDAAKAPAGDRASMPEHKQP